MSFSVSGRRPSPRYPAAVGAACAVVLAIALAGCTAEPDASVSPSPAAPVSPSPAPTASAGTPETRLAAAITATADAMPGGVTTRLASAANETGEIVVTCTTVYAQGATGGPLEQAVMRVAVVPGGDDDRLATACQDSAGDAQAASTTVLGSDAWVRQYADSSARAVHLSDAAVSQIGERLGSTQPWALLQADGARVTAQGATTFVVDIPVTPSGDAQFAPFDVTAADRTGRVAGLERASFTLRATVTIEDGRLARIDTTAPELDGQALQNVSVIETIEYGKDSPVEPSPISTRAPREAASLDDLLYAD